MAEIRSSTRRLESLAAIGWGKFASNADNFAIAEHHPRRSLEASAGMLSPNKHWAGQQTIEEFLNQIIKYLDESN